MSALDRPDMLPTRPLADRRWLALALYSLLHAGLALAFVCSTEPGTGAPWRGLPLDDAWIHWAFAESLARGEPFEYLPGRPEPGFTSPLWIVLLAIPGLFLDDPSALAIAAKVLGTALGVGASLAAHLAARSLASRIGTRRPELSGLIAGTLVALDPHLAFAQVSGMEVTLAGACLALALWAFLERAALPAGIACALAFLARPECALLAFAFGVVAIGERAGARALASLTGPTALSGIGWSAFCVATAGRPLPNTFYVKHQPMSVWSSVEDLPELVRGIASSPWMFAGAGLVLIAAAAAAHPERLDRTRALALVFPVVFLGGVLWAHDLEDGGAFYYRRYWMPILPWVAALLGVGARALADRGHAMSRALLAGVVLASLGALPFRLISQSNRYAWNCQNIEEMQVELGRWIAAHTEPQDYIATHDVGALRIFSRRPVLDLSGLVDHRMPEEARELFDELSPRYFVVFPSWFPRMVRSAEHRVVHRVRSPRYTICECDQEEMVVLERVDR